MQLLVIVRHDVLKQLSSARQGTQVVVAYRDPDEARHLKVTGDLGQIVPLVKFYDRGNRFSTRSYIGIRNSIYVTRSRLLSA